MVLDPFAGCAYTAVAAKELGRQVGEQRALTAAHSTSGDGVEMTSAGSLEDLPVQR